MNSFMQLNTTEKDIPFQLFYDYGSSVVPNHWHKEIEIIYSIRGCTDVVINNTLYHIEQGGAAIINSGDIHYYHCTKDHERVVIIFNLDILEDEYSHSKYKSQIQKRMELVCRSSSEWNEKCRREFSDIIVRLTRLHDSKMLGRDLAIKARIFDLILLMCNRMPQMEKPFPASTNLNHIKVLENLKPIFDYVDENYMNDISLKDAAAEINFAISYFARFFKRNTGTTFISFLNQYRINRAQWFLLNEDCSITDIAFRVGFQSVKTFNRIFKSITGESPRQYKRSINE